MKILLSKKWRYELITIICIHVLCIIIGVLSFLRCLVVMLLLSIYGLVMMTVVEIIILCSCHRLLTYVSVENGFYKSYLFKKCLCVIDRSKPIYYVIFSAQEGMFSKREFIVISNEPFTYEEKRSLRIFPWEQKPLIVSYDTQKQLALPYNQETRPILEINKWKSVKQKSGSTGDGSLC